MNVRWIRKVVRFCDCGLLLFAAAAADAVASSRLREIYVQFISIP